MANNFWKKNFDPSENLYTLVFEVAEYEFKIRIPKFKMAEPKWPMTFEKKKCYSSENLYTSVFEVAEYKFEIELPKFNMVDPKWPPTFEKKIWFKRNFVLFCFWGHWIWIWNHKFKIANPKCRRALKKIDFIKTLSTSVFKIPDYEFEIEIPNFKIADPK